MKQLFLMLVEASVTFEVEADDERKAIHQALMTVRANPDVINWKATILNTLDHPAQGRCL